MSKTPVLVVGSSNAMQLHCAAHSITECATILASADVPLHNAVTVPTVALVRAAVIGALQHMADAPVDVSDSESDSSSSSDDHHSNVLVVTLPHALLIGARTMHTHARLMPCSGPQCC